MQSCSKGSRGLSVPLRVSGIFTGNTISPSSWSRQCPDRYTIRAGRNLPDKEFRYLRTVIVTAASILQSHVFLVNSRLGLLSAAPPLERPLSRSYRTILPSSLTMNLSCALVFSTRSRVSVYSTGAADICLADFLGGQIGCIIRAAGALRYYRRSPRGAYFTTPLSGYGLQPAIPSAGTGESLIFRRAGFPPALSLLMPTFAFPPAPPCLAAQLLSWRNALLPMPKRHPMASVACLCPRIIHAGTLD